MAVSFGLATLCWGYQQPDPMQQLIQVRQKISESMNRIPRYLCTETVERSMVELPLRTGRNLSCPEIVAAFKKNPKHLEVLSADRLRLDVAVLGEREAYSWVGEGRFGDQALGTLVKSGLTANGSFGSFLKEIFVSDAA